MTERWSRRAQCSFSSAAPDSEESPEPVGTVGAEGSSTAARARSSREPASLTAALTPTSTTGLPAKRSRSLTGRSWAKMTASARLMRSGSSQSILPDP